MITKVKKGLFYHILVDGKIWGIVEGREYADELIGIYKEVM